MAQMSIAELRERLEVTKRREKQEETDKRVDIVRKRQKKEELLVAKAANITRIRDMANAQVNKYKSRCTLHFYSRHLALVSCYHN